VISTPVGFTSYWEDEEPAPEIRTKVSEFARRMVTADLTPIRDEPPNLPEQAKRRLAELRAEREQTRPRDWTPGHQERVRTLQQEGSVFLRLKVRDGSAEDNASSHSPPIDFEHGPMGAPPNYPRVIVNDLFRHASETA
jgi:hypothetical protein